MRRISSAVIAIVWLASSSVLLAQTPPPIAFADPVNGLTIDQAIATARNNVPSLKAARAAISAAEARRAQAGLRPNPTVSTMWRREIGGMDRMNDVFVDLPLDLFRRRPRIAAAEADIGVAEAEAETVLFGAELEVRRRYGAALTAIRRVEIARELETAARQTFEVLAARAEEGAAPALDRDLARVELDRMSARVSMAEAGARAAVVDLAVAMGTAPDQTLRLRDSLEAALSQPNVRAFALDPGRVGARPDVRAAGARVRARDASIEQARSEGRWDLSVSAGYTRMRSGFPFRAFDAAGTLSGIEATFHNLTFGAMVMVPVFNRNQGLVAAATAERTAVEAELEGARLAALAETARAATLLRAALEVVDRYRTAVVPQAVRNVDTTVQGYNLGRGTLFDVLQAREQLLRIQDEYTDALARAYEAFVSAIAARGGLTS